MSVLERVYHEARVCMSKAITFKHRVVIVTGAGNGLGRSFALGFARRGASVVVNDLGTASDGRGVSRSVADIVAAEITAAGGIAVSSYESVAAPDGGAKILQTALDAFGRVDVLVSNAGFLRNAPFDEMRDEDVDSVLDTHLRGAFRVAQAAFRVMKRQGYGRCVFSSSGAGMFGNPYQANYSAAKAGIAGLSHVLAIEGASHNIMSNAILPVAITRLASAMGPDFNRDAPDLSSVLSELTPEYVAPLVLYLASEHCRHSHGLYSAVAGRYARVFTGVTRGWFCAPGRPPSPEEMEKNWMDVEHREGYYEPLSHMEEFGPVLVERSSRVRNPGRARE
jgi:NAD(P)-dependent dehydrogenase (short-subunit alcohol dehydrogenase family)